MKIVMEARVNGLRYATMKVRGSGMEKGAAAMSEISVETLNLTCVGHV